MEKILNKFEKISDSLSNIFMAIALLCIGAIAGVIYLNFGDLSTIRDILITKMTWVVVIGLCSMCAVLFTSTISLAVLDKKSPRTIGKYVLGYLLVFSLMGWWFCDKIC
jgi:hypothetical protein